MHEHSHCGIGVIANRNNLGNRKNLLDGLTLMKRLEHRAGFAPDGTSDGAGIMVDLPKDLLRAFGYEDGMMVASFMVDKRVSFEGVLELLKEKYEVFGHRRLQTENSVLTDYAKSLEPDFFHVFLDEVNVLELERHLENTYSVDDVYLMSCSKKTIVYKGLLNADDFVLYFNDLADERFKTRFTLIHQRFSTNTLPKWRLAQPFRMIAHNGEINTIKGNVNWGNTRLISKGKHPFLKMSQSDSANLDAYLTDLYEDDAHIEKHLMSLLPSAFEKKTMKEACRKFYLYEQIHQEAWDGPAAVLVSDGNRIVSTLDRNGLRPIRYAMTEDSFVLSSEMGVVDFPFEAIEVTGKISASELVAFDLETGEIALDEALKDQVVSKVDAHSLVVMQPKPFVPSGEEVDEHYYGYTEEVKRMIVSPMAINGAEPIYSLSYDAPLAVLSPKPHLLYDYFKQQFAEVTNPPIDAIREEVVFSLTSYVRTSETIYQYQTPFITKTDYEQIVTLDGVDVLELSLGFSGTLEDALEALKQQILNFKGNMIVLKEHPTQLSIPILLAVMYAHKLVSNGGNRLGMTLVLVGASCKETHHMATLLGFGADFIFPFHALDLASQEGDKGVYNYLKALDKGLLKIMSKMGISVLNSYRGAKTFDCVGLSQALLDVYTDDVSSLIGGLSIDGLNQMLISRQQEGISVSEYGIGKTDLPRAYKSKDFNQLRLLLEKESYGDFVEWSNMEKQKQINIRDLFEFERQPIPIEDVESEEKILKRFVGGAMSFGSLSPKAHYAIAKVFNTFGGRSNSGEGGELEERYHTIYNSSVKQVASGRFGVTANYLLSGDEVQIKMAQGAKPGEGGHLPGKKVNDIIAKTRYTKEGTSLISPPPHHDIYSIEDLAQLIYDIKSVTDGGMVSVKLVSLSNVSVVASGVVKTGADKIVISGYNGGTGASPLSSLKNAGLPFEIGLKSTHDLLSINGLRPHVLIQTDGQIRTAFDVVSAFLLGADEVAFGVMSLMGLGCIACHKCHTNTCPTGLTTGDPRYQKLYRGNEDILSRYYLFLARHTREIMAELGFRSVDEMIGHANRIQLDHPLLDLPLTHMPLRKPFMKRDFHNPVNDRLVDGREKIELINTDRSFGALIGKVKPSQREFHTSGAAGQSYGAFVPEGYTLIHTGFVNDSFGKGLSGGVLVVKSSNGHKDLVGNVALYGATSGFVHVEGTVGERFAIRNSGVVAVCEGMGAHGCEYMTGGTVLCLGEVGVNFGAGMSGGVAYLRKDVVSNHLNNDVQVQELEQNDRDILRHLIERHLKHTDSAVASSIDLNNLSSLFMKVIPM